MLKKKIESIFVLLIVHRFENVSDTTMPYSNFLANVFSFFFAYLSFHVIKEGYIFRLTWLDFSLDLAVRVIQM